MLTPDDCFLAENIVKQSKEVQMVLMERYGITDVNTQVTADP
jgi:Cu2+-containing amine oxidase